MSYQAIKTHRGNLNAYYVQKPIQKGYVHGYDSNYTALWKSQDYGDTSKVSG
jgi:hypothetical protein